VKVGDGSTLRRGRPPVERLRYEIRFQDLPEDTGSWCSTLTESSGACSVTASSIGGTYREVPTTWEAIMDFDPDDAQQYLDGVDYPASKQEVASAAEGNGAPEELVGMIQSLGTPEFSSPEQVVTELRSFPQSS
jgi:hypothetical protein